MDLFEVFGCEGGLVGSTGGSGGETMVGSVGVLYVSGEVSPKLTPHMSAKPNKVVDRGIDLRNRSEEVKKLLFAGYGRMLKTCGYDPEDVLQEVYKGLLVRNRGKCPWDGQKSSFGHYVHMVCGCIVSNYHRKMKRLRKNEQIGMVNREGELVDASGEATGGLIEMELGNLVGEDFKTYVVGASEKSRVGRKEKLLVVLGLMSQGYERGEIMSLTGMTVCQVENLMREVRRMVGDYVLSPFVSLGESAGGITIP